MLRYSLPLKPLYSRLPPIRKDIRIYKTLQKYFLQIFLLKKSSYPLSITSLNVTKSALNRGFGYIY